MAYSSKRTDRAVLDAVVELQEEHNLSRSDIEYLLAWIEEAEGNQENPTPDDVSDEPSDDSGTIDVGLGLSL